MADLYFEVDTAPLADSVNSVRKHLTGVTVAVTAMEAAVIATERESSKKICANVDEGFYMLVKSQTSQKAVAAYTEMVSKQVSLLQLVKALDNIKRQMEKDFNMIARRYTKLFQSLNKALESRVKEIDRPAMQLAGIKKSIVFDKLKDDSSMLFNVSEEALPIAQTALSGKLKQKTRDTMQRLSESIDENNSYNKKVDSILAKEENNFSSNTDLHYIPVILLTTDSMLNSGDCIDNVYIANSDAWQNTAPIVPEINRRQDDLKWTPSNNEEKTFVRKEVLALCEKESNDERISREIIRLFDESMWEEC